jgi:hypothetical protein
MKHNIHQETISATVKFAYETLIHIRRGLIPMERMAALYDNNPWDDLTKGSCPRRKLAATWIRKIARRVRYLERRKATS